MVLKVIHIDRRKIDFESKAQELWETVLKPKWEKRSRARAGKLTAALIRNGKTSTPEFTIQKERIVPGEKLKIVIEVDGNGSYKILIIMKEDLQGPEGRILFPYAVQM